MKGFHNFPQTAGSVSGTMTSATSQEITLAVEDWEPAEDGYKIPVEAPELGLASCDQAILWLQPADSCTKTERMSVRKSGMDTTVEETTPVVLIDEIPQIEYKVQIVALKIVGGGV